MASAVAKANNVVGANCKHKTKGHSKQNENRINYYEPTADRG